MTLPLAGVTVVDVTMSIAGPYCTLILGALGADVIKVERADGGDDSRRWGPPFWNGESATYLAMNANKRSITLDLKSGDGRAKLLELAASSDVFVHSLRPGASAKLGLEFEDVRAVNDRIVYCSVGAFGSVGPRSAQPGYDPLMQAAAGVMSITGEADGNPVRAGASIVDQGTGLWCAVGILAALRQRDATASAHLVETSLFETAVNWLPYQIVGYLATGHTPGRFGSGISILAPYQLFDTADGHVMIAAGNDRIFASLCEAIRARSTASDPRYRTNELRVENRESLVAEIAQHVSQLSSEELLERLEDAGVPAAPLQDVAQVVADPQTEALGLIQAVDHPRIDAFRLVALPLSLDGERVEHRRRPPDLGEHGNELGL